MSKSADKLALLVRAFEAVPKETFDRVQSFELSWESIDSGDGEAMVCPVVKATFKG